MEILNLRLEVVNKVESSDEIWGLAKKCDWFIHLDQVVNLSNTSSPNTIFLYSKVGDVTLSFFIRDILPTIQNIFNLIISGDDYTFPSGNGDIRKNHYINLQNEIYNTLFTNKYLNLVFVENLDTLHYKCKPLPLGLLKNSLILKYSKNYTNYENLIEYVPLNISSKQKLVMYCNINRDDIDQFLKRRMVRDVCYNEWNYFVDCYDEVIYEDILPEEELKNLYLTYKFCFCIHGGGIDLCPKIWQALLCGCIPIIEHSTMDEVYSKFPVVFVESWNPPFYNAVSPELLNKKFEELRPYYEDETKRKKVLEMLTLDYWWNIISNTRSNIYTPSSKLFSDLQNFNTSIIIKKNNIYTNIIESLNEKHQFDLIYRSCYSTRNWSILYMKTNNYIEKKEGKLTYEIDEKNIRFNNGSECCEDPRFIVIDNILYALYSIVYNYYNYPEIKQVITPVNNLSKIIHFTGVDLYIDKNNVTIEKNWSIFQLNTSKKVYMIYSFLPKYVLYEVDKETFHCTQKITCTYNNVPIIRGGCMPIEIEDKLYFFAHSSSLSINKEYVLSLVVIDVKTLHVIGYIEDCLKDKKSEFDKKIYFCRGSLYIKEEALFIISCGIDDEYTQFLHISKHDIDENIIYID
jgi:hypothetical protein